MDNEIKMFIAGEEVVSQNEFTINEEMLSASSTILNNCYPKSWENDKDYTSRFYYPKDYSKFLLGKGNFEKGSEEYAKIKVSGTNEMQYDTNIEKEWNTFNVYGKTTQETAPVQVLGKNLLCVGNVSSTADLTITKEGNSIIKINGTTTSLTALTIPLIYGTQLTNITYTFSVHLSGNVINKSIYLSLNPSNNLHNLELPANSGISSKSSSAENGKTFTTLQIGIESGTTFNNVEIMVQLEQGSSATSFEDFTYTPPKPSPSNPSDLVSVGYKNLFNINGDVNTRYNGTTGTQNSVSGNDLTSTTNGSSTTAYGQKIYVGAGNQVILSAKLKSITYSTEPSGTSVVGYLTLYNENTTTGRASVSFSYSGIGEVKGATFVATTDYIYATVSRASASTSATFTDIQVLVGNATSSVLTSSYVPYNKYGIELKISTGKNLFDKDSVVYKNGYAKDDNGNDITSNSGGYTASYIKVKPETKYTINGSLVTNTGTFRIYFYDNSKTWISRTNSYGKSSIPVTFTTPSNCYYIQFSYIINAYDASTIQIEEGQTATEYEPYISNTYLYTLDNPLRSIGDTKDRLYIENNNLYVERNIAYIDSYNGEAITTDYMSTTGGLDTGASVQYITDKYIEDLGQVNIPYSYVGQNNVSFYTGIDTTEDFTYYWKNYKVLFAGIVKNSGDISLNPRYPHYCSLQVLDYKTFLSESDTLDYVISNKTIREAIGMVVNSVAGYGFIVGNIDISSADDKIGAYSTLNKTAYDVLQYLADISGARWRARYVDSSTMAIDFYDIDTLPQGADIEYNKEYWEQNNIVDLTFNYGTRDYRNKQIILSDEIYASIDYVETLLSNGYDTNFITQNNVGIIKSIMVNGLEVTFASASEREMGVTAQFYYTPGKNVLESSSSYSAGTQIILTYVPLVKGRQIVYNNAEILRIAEQTDTTGVISRYENRNDILSSDELEQIAKTYIEYKGKAEVILTLTTQNKDLYNIGEVVYFDAPIPDLQQKYMVKTKKIEYAVIKEVINLFYVYELTSSFNSEKAINYFDNQRNKSFGNIAEGESITRNIDITNVANIIWNNLTITEITITPDGDNVLNSALNSPFIE